MISQPPKNAPLFLILGSLILLLMFMGISPGAAQAVVLHLKGGDQISGVIVSQSTNQVVVSNAWAGAISVPLAEIASRSGETNILFSTNNVAAMAAQTNAVAKATVSNAPPAQVALKASPSGKNEKEKPKGSWHGQVNVGLDTLIAATSQQNYFGKLKLTYQQPYQSNPKQFFRNTTQVSGQYQRTDGQQSANNANGNNKTDFDFARSYYAYSSAGAGFDEVNKIDLQYQLGPGLGRHVVRTDNTALDVESGIDYETQYRRDTDNLESFFLRLAEDWNWKIKKNLKLSEKFAFYPNLEPVDAGQYRIEFTSTLSYGFWQNLSLDLTLDNSYNTQVAPGVQRNQFEARITLGASF